MIRGRGFAHAHHGEFLQGVFRSPGGARRRGLVSLPCGIFGSEASFVYRPKGALIAGPGGKWKARRAAEIALARLGRGGAGGRLTIRCRAPERLGLGSSTSDAVAAIRAVADALGARFSAEEISSIAVEAERASDPAAYGRRCLLFAQREGEVIEDFRRPVPDFEVIGFNADPAGRGVDTLKLSPPAYSTAEIDRCDAILAAFRTALERGDLAGAAGAATRSARLNQRHLRLNGFDLIEETAGRIGALGIQIAHSGSVAGFLFPPGGAAHPDLAKGLAALRSEIGIAGFWRFRTGGGGAPEIQIPVAHRHRRRPALV